MNTIINDHHQTVLLKIHITCFKTNSSFKTALPEGEYFLQDFLNFSSLLGSSENLDMSGLLVGASRTDCSDVLQLRNLDIDPPATSSDSLVDTSVKKHPDEIRGILEC